MPLSVPWIEFGENKGKQVFVEQSASTCCIATYCTMACGADGTKVQTWILDKCLGIFGRNLVWTSQPEQNAYILQAKWTNLPKIYKTKKWMKMKARTFACRLVDTISFMSSLQLPSNKSPALSNLPSLLGHFQFACGLQIATRRRHSIKAIIRKWEQ